MSEDIPTINMTKGVTVVNASMLFYLVFSDLGLSAIAQRMLVLTYGIGIVLMFSEYIEFGLGQIRKSLIKGENE